MSAGYKVGPGVLNEDPDRFAYLFDPAAPVRPPTPEEQALYEQRCAEGADLHDLAVLAEAPADLPVPSAARLPSESGSTLIPGYGRNGEPQTPDREVEDEGRALGGLNNAQLPGPELAPRNAGHEDRAGGLDDTETVTRVISDGGER